jgi:hypothetical protein
VDFLDFRVSAALAPTGSMATPPRLADLLAQPFVKAMLDPTLIPGIYDTCDQWCMYCPATAHCLAYRCRPDGACDEEPQEIYINIADRLFEGMRLMKDLHAAEGRTIPELEAMLADDPRGRVTLVPVDDPLERLGRRYARLSSRYLASHPDFPFEMTHRPAGPTPLEVFAWYHVLIAVKIYRAITSSAAAARGEDFQRQDALFSAKAALLGIDRSRAALSAMEACDEDARLGEMQAQLRRLAREVEGRFPEARGQVRPGLDGPAQPAGGCTGAAGGT